MMKLWRSKDMGKYAVNLKRINLFASLTLMCK